MLLIFHTHAVVKSNTTRDTHPTGADPINGLSIIELVDSISRDGPDTPIYVIQNKMPKLSPDTFLSF